MSDPLRTEHMLSTDVIKRHIAGQLRRRLKELEINGKEFGAMIGKTEQQASLYLRGRHRLFAGRLFEIAQMLGVPIDYFYEGLPATAPRAKQILTPGLYADEVARIADETVQADMRRLTLHIAGHKGNRAKW